MQKIVVDVFGCDNPPSEIIKGAICSLEDTKDICIVLSGDKDIIQDVLKGYNYDPNRLEILDAKEVITNSDVPTNAIKEKKNSSLIKAINYLKENDDATSLISCGSTGAVLCSATIILGRLDRVSRPALASILPTENDTSVCLLDCGANVDCKAEMLREFAIMGSACLKAMNISDNPKVALLSVGTEDEKGNLQTKEAFKLIKNSSLTFLGNMEARDALSGKYDVIVCDGFQGNILLKSIEGTAKFVIKKMAKKLFSSFDKNEKENINKCLNDLTYDLDYAHRGGAILLGVKKIIIKGHGQADASTIYHCINQAIKLSDGKLIDKLKKTL